jgi:archaellin
MKKVLSILTACMLVTDFTFASLLNQVREGVRLRDVVVNNPGSNNPVAAENPIPYANITLNLPRGSEAIDLTTETPLSFNSLLTNVTNTYSLNKATGELTLHKAGLYTVDFFFSLRNKGEAGTAAVYAAIDGVIVPRTSTFRTFLNSEIGSIDNTITFAAKAGAKLQFIFTTRGTYQTPRGPRRENLAGPIRNVEWAPFSYGITFLGGTCPCS